MSCALKHAVYYGPITYTLRVQIKHPTVIASVSLGMPAARARRFTAQQMKETIRGKAFSSGFLGRKL